MHKPHSVVQPARLLRKTVTRKRRGGWSAKIGSVPQHPANEWAAQEHSLSLTVVSSGALHGDEPTPLSGRFWFKKTWRGKLLLLVEEGRPRRFKSGEAKLRWCEAKLLDLAEMPMQPLMELVRVSRSTYNNRHPALRIVEPPPAYRAS